MGQEYLHLFSASFVYSLSPNTFSMVATCGENKLWFKYLRILVISCKFITLRVLFDLSCSSSSFHSILALQSLKTHFFFNNVDLTESEYLLLSSRGCYHFRHFLILN